MKTSELIKIGSIFIISAVLLILVQLGFELLSLRYQDDLEYQYIVVTLLNLVWYLGMALSFYFAIKPSLKLEFASFKALKTYEKAFFVVRGLLLMYAVQIGVTLVLDALNAFDVSNNQEAIITLAGIGPLTQISLILFSVFLAPFTEEILFRRVLYKWLEKKSSRVLAVLLASILFGLIHGLTELSNPIVLLPYVAVGIILQIFYIRSQTLFVPIIMHSVFNLVGVTVILITTYFPSVLS